MQFGQSLQFDLANLAMSPLLRFAQLKTEKKTPKKARSKNLKLRVLWFASR